MPDSPPGPPSRYFGQHFLALSRDPLAFLTRLKTEYGDIAQIRLGGQPMVALSHPDQIRALLVTDHRLFAKGRGLERAKRMLGQGLLTSEGEFHLRQRRLVQPAFHRERIQGYGMVMADATARHLARWQDGGEVDIHREMMALTLTIVARTLFSADVSHEVDELGQAISASVDLFRQSLLPFGQWLEYLPLGPGARFRATRRRLDATIQRFIDEHRAGGDQGDLLSMLILAQDDEAHGERMTDLQLRDESMTLFLAGHETTANAASWGLYLLSRHPEIAARVRQEVAGVVGEGAPGPDDLPALPYTTMVVAEVMRLYPPAWTIGRRALQDWDVAGYRIVKGTLILASPWVTHRDPRWWPDPLRFDPLRFTESAKATRPKFAYFPFGGGPRICVGEQFAWMEGVLIVASVLQRFEFEPVNPAATVVPAPSITLRPRGGLPMRVRRLT
ncbi:MAG: cytochrome P450 [Gemmatimonadota bacterium]